MKDSKGRDTTFVGKGRTFRNARKAAQWLTEQGFVVEQNLGIIVRLGKGRLARAFTEVKSNGRASVRIVEVADEGVSPTILGTARKSPTGDTGDDSGS